MSEQSLGSGHLVWIVSSSSVEAVQEFGITGALSVRQSQGNNYQLLLHDAIRVITHAVPNSIKNMGDVWVEPLKECKDSVNGWKLGPTLYKYVTLCCTIFLTTQIQSKSCFVMFLSSRFAILVIFMSNFFKTFLL